MTYEHRGSVVSNLRVIGFAAICAAIFIVVLLPLHTKANTLFQSTNDKSYPIPMFNPSQAPHWFGVSNTPSIFLGTWTGPDATTTASTTVHFWAQWNGVYAPILDAGVGLSTGGDPYYVDGSFLISNLAPGNTAFLQFLADSTSTLTEYILPTKLNQPVHQGDSLWGFFIPSFSAYGSNYNFGSDATGTPRVAVCEGDCNPDATTAPSACTENCNSNVLFLPGIEGSKLYTQGLVSENQIWEPNSLVGHDVNDLDLTNSSAVNGVYTKEKDIIDDAYGFYGVYDAFTRQMNELVATNVINDWSPVAYDWRLDYQTLLNSGNETNDGRLYYNGTNAGTTTPYIIQELKNLAATSKTGKVTIIAHSNGGLLAKVLLMQPDISQYIDKVIFVATPQLGTPKAIGGILHGYDMGLLFPLTPFFNEADARFVGKSMPSAYSLLPSKQFFSTVTSPVVTFDQNTLPNWVAKYGTSITSEDQLRNFMTDSSDTLRSQVLYNDTATPIVASSTLFDNSAAVHASLDNWEAPPGVQVITIAGWGLDTLSSIAYRAEPALVCKEPTLVGGCNQFSFVSNVVSYDPGFTNDGDGTVLDTSAQWTNNSPTTRYWLNLAQLNATSTLFKHDNIMEAHPLLSLIADVVTNATSSLPEGISTYKPADTGIIDSHVNLILHSPLTLGFIDSQGNYTGATATTTEFNIPGVDYERLGGVQWLSIPKNLAGQVVMRGVASGSFALDVEQVKGNNTVATTTFAAIPSSTSTVATLAISPDVSPTASSTLLVDYDGNGTTDFIYHVKEGSIVLPDITAPTTTVARSGVSGTNDWFTSDVVVTFNATDTESGVAGTFVSLDGATSTQATSTTVRTNGIHTLAYYSIDNAGNTEQATTTIIKIDKTAPEASITVSTSTKDIVVTGIDSVSSTTVAKTATSTTITDAAGNVTKLIFQKTYLGSLLMLARLKSIQYGTSTPISLPSSFLYIWNPLTSPPTLLSQTVTVDKNYLIESAYNKSKNKTTVVVLKKNVPIQTTTVLGLDIIRLTTNVGAINYSL